MSGDPDDKEDTLQFFRQCTDTQLEHNLAFEYDRYNHGDYDMARIAAAERGWTVRSGRRL